MEVGGLGEARDRPLRLRGRDGLEHLALAALRMVEGGGAPACPSPEELGGERHLALQHDAFGHGSVGGDYGGDHEGGLRSIRRAGARPESPVRAGGGHGQPICPQGRAGARADRGCGVQAALPAALLARHEPHRSGLLEGEGHLEEDPGPRLLRALRIPGYGSTVLTSALASPPGIPWPPECPSL